jgi:hypothetical protein
MYSNHIDELQNNSDFFLASHFSRNRNALVIFGNENLVITNLI